MWHVPADERGTFYGDVHCDHVWVMPRMSEARHVCMSHVMHPSGWVWRLFGWCAFWSGMSHVSRACRKWMLHITFSRLQIGRHRILRLFQKKINEPEFCPWDLRLVAPNKMVLMINPMRILVRLVLNWMFSEIISRFWATLSAIGWMAADEWVDFLGDVRFDQVWVVSRV